MKEIKMIHGSGDIKTRDKMQDKIYNVKLWEKRCKSSSDCNTGYQQSQIANVHQLIQSSLSI